MMSSFVSSSFRRSTPIPIPIRTNGEGVALVVEFNRGLMLVCHERLVSYSSVAPIGRCTIPILVAAPENRLDRIRCGAYTQPRTVRPDSWAPNLL